MITMPYAPPHRGAFSCPHSRSTIGQQNDPNCDMWHKLNLTIALNLMRIVQMAIDSSSVSFTDSSAFHQIPKCSQAVSISLGQTYVLPMHQQPMNLEPIWELRYQAFTLRQTPGCSFPPVSGKLSAALLLLYFSGGRDRMMTWDIHRNVRLRC